MVIALGTDVYSIHDKPERILLYPSGYLQLAWRSRSILLCMTRGLKLLRSYLVLHESRRNVYIVRSRSTVRQIFQSFPGSAFKFRTRKHLVCSSNLKSASESFPIWVWVVAHEWSLSDQLRLLTLPTPPVKMLQSLELNLPRRKCTRFDRTGQNISIEQTHPSQIWISPWIRLGRRGSRCLETWDFHRKPSRGEAVGYYHIIGQTIVGRKHTNSSLSARYDIHGSSLQLGWCLQLTFLRHFLSTIL